MGILATISLAILAVALLVAVLFFGRLPVFRRTPVAWLHRACAVHVPAAVLAADARLTGGRLGATLRRAGHVLVYDRHPTVLVLFVVLLAGAEGLALPEAWPQLGGGQRAVLVVLCALPFVFLRLAAAADPGAVTLATLPRHLLRYPYDYALFLPGARCATCRLLKPPRSKHCSVCKRCVGRLDHHCIFINNCVGVGNHHWFLLLLLATAVLASYGGLVGLGLVADRVRAEPCPGFSLVPWWTRRAVAAATTTTAPGSGGGSGGSGGSGDARMPFSFWLLYLTWGLRATIRVGCVSLFGLLISPLVWGLLAFNVWNVYAGQTTNESLKWSDWQADMADGFVYRRRLGGAGPCSQAEGPGAASPWPLPPEHVLVRTDDGKPPPADLSTDAAADRRRLPGVGPWEPVWTLRDVENLYDLGFWNNLVDVFAPDHVFRAAPAPGGLPRVERGRPRKRVARV